MAEEEKTGLQTAENTEQADSQAETGTPEKTEAKEVDWEQRHKDAQEKIRQQGVELADYERKAQERDEAAEELPEDYAEETFVDKKTVNQMIDTAVKKEVQKVRMQTADSYFRRTYPKIVKHENIISGILRNPKDPASLKGASAEERIDAAVKEFNALTEEAIATAKTEAETDAKEREEKNRKAAGLGGPVTTPPKSDDEGKSDEDELKDRKARQAKRRGF